MIGKKKQRLLAGVAASVLIAGAGYASPMPRDLVMPANASGLGQIWLAAAGEDEVLPEIPDENEPSDVTEIGVDVIEGGVIEEDGDGTIAVEVDGGDDAIDPELGDPADGFVDTTDGFVETMDETADSADGFVDTSDGFVEPTDGSVMQLDDSGDIPKEWLRREVGADEQAGRQSGSVSNDDLPAAFLRLKTEDLSH
ncbi:hypothetical protein [Paracoccus zhejiangensis]|uniref:Uncharacterized protein n=1 Tax=Paracoccus zhejiangensis TaxID=1077935 RepID=A0A2H5EVJ3_9RHOB|nr:hypothetical protein [Paracoccus zhejiangensis]AUH63300.1 hypothetical protein CX676_03295 [Paracoccus zhejiangensis]